MLFLKYNLSEKERIMKKFLALFLILIMTAAVAPINAFAEESKEVTYIEINLDPGIAGKSPADYRDFLTVSGEGVELGSGDYFKTTYLENVNGFAFSKEAETLEEGVHYKSWFNVYPKEGYTLSGNMDFEIIKFYIHRSTGTVEGSASYTPCELTVDGTAEYYQIMIEYTVEEQEPEGFAKIIKAISDFFLAIAEFFTETLIQPIADLFMKRK